MLQTTRTMRVAAVAAVLFAMTAHVGRTQSGVFPPDPPPPPGPMTGMPVPLPTNLAEFVVDMQAAKVLGKAFFWDQQAGSDGLACASCHFQAGADNRVKNVLDPQLRATDATRQGKWYKTASNKTLPIGPPPGGGPNYTLKTLDFPFHQLTDPLDRNSKVLFDTPNVVSSTGVFRADFDHVNVINNRSDAAHQLKKVEVCKAALSPTFSIGGINTRQVEPRNTPTVINAVFNFRNFWDGRANNVFNGRNPFGLRDVTAGTDPLNSVLAVDAATGLLVPYYVAMADGSLASQAVGPPGSNLEMSCNGRVFEEIGKKMLQLKPLGLQDVDTTDSLLGPWVNPKGPVGGPGNDGLRIDYPTLIKKAFQPKFWNSNRISADGYTLMQKNFSLYWGIAIMLYESTLVSDNTPFDQQMTGNPTAMTDAQLKGFSVFTGNGGCFFCHKGPEFTSAASALRENSKLGGLVEHMLMGDGTTALYDSGFYNIGVRSPNDDIGIGATDPWGNPLSVSREAKNYYLANPGAFNGIGIGPDMFNVYPCNFQVSPCIQVTGNFRDSIDGSVKVPTLRNVELTGPYFHNGGQATLEQVVAFYNRGGDGAGTDASNTTGFGPNPTNRAPAIFPLNLSATDQANLVAFLKELTDERVRWEKAPFDHPSLSVPVGHPVNEMRVLKNPTTIYADDTMMTIPAVGAAGRTVKQGPLKAFDAGLK
jgi:cytochrome c peroxidase